MLTQKVITLISLLILATSLLLYGCQERERMAQAADAPVADVQSVTPPVPVDEPTVAPEATSHSSDWESGRKLYRLYCAACHGDEGEGIADVGSAVNTAEIAGRDSAELEQLINNGIVDTTMVPYAGVLDREAVRSLTIYLQHMSETP